MFSNDLIWNCFIMALTYIWKKILYFIFYFSMYQYFCTDPLPSQVWRHSLGVQITSGSLPTDLQNQVVSLLYLERPDVCQFIYHLVVLGLLGALSQFSDSNLFQSCIRDFADGCSDVDRCCGTLFPLCWFHLIYDHVFRNIVYLPHILLSYELCSWLLDR